MHPGLSLTARARQQLSEGKILASSPWHRYGFELEENGFMYRRGASINEYRFDESGRRIFHPAFSGHLLDFSHQDR